MKLKNKKTGEIIELLAKPSFIKRNDDYLQSEVNTFNSLAELNEEWEDYEEPEHRWYINDIGEPEQEGKAYVHEMNPEKLKAIGNYFETKEEAEKAVEKLKAWKRLKDKGVEFYGWRRNHTGTYDFLARWRGIPPKMYEIIDDLDTCFGGEE